MGLSSFLPRVFAGVDPWTALTTDAPKASPTNSTGSASYAPYGGTINANNYDPTSNGAAASGGMTPKAVAAPAATGPAIDPNIGQYKSQISDRIKNLQGIYDQLFGQVDQNVADQRGQVDKSFATNNDQLGNDFQNSIGAIGQSYAGRGLSDSSYLGDAQGNATKAYNTGVDQLNQGREANYAALGKFADTTKASLGANRDAFNRLDLSQYTDPSQLLSIRDQIDQALSAAQVQSAGMKTGGQYRADLNAATPGLSQTASTALKSQLAKLAQSGASSVVTAPMAANFIKQAGVDPSQSSYWNDYYKSLVGGGVPAAA